MKPNRIPTGASSSGQVPISNFSRHTDSEIAFLRRSLLSWFRRYRRELPWRRTTDPYAIWLSEIMLQQTRVESVIPYFERFLAAFPTVERLSRASSERVLRVWAGLGYYSRARNLHQAAKAVVRDHAGKFPATADGLRTLPGVGRYTAAAIASIAYGQAVAVLDGNVKRVIARLLSIRDSIDSPAMIERLWAEAARLLSQQHPGDFNQAMMELGATVCTPRNPSCDTCPISKICRANAKGIAGELPARNSKVPVRQIFSAALAIVQDNHVLLKKRVGKGLLGGFWSLPGVEWETRKIDGEQLCRRVSGQISAEIRVGRKLGNVRHEFTHRSLSMEIFAARFKQPFGGEMLEAGDFGGLCWHRLDGKARVPLATLDLKVLEVVKSAVVSADWVKREVRT